MTARLDVTLKTTEQNRIVRTAKSEAEVTNNKKLRSKYCTIEAIKLTTDRHEALHGLFATAELLVISLPGQIGRQAESLCSQPVHSSKPPSVRPCDSKLMKTILGK